MWTLASFQPTSFFSLRPANATTSGGKTLLTPTPFSLKMALLDVAIRLYGKEQGLAWFPALRDLAVAVRLPQHLSVVNTFVKIMRPHKNGPKDVYGTGLLAPLGNTIAYKEYVHYPTPIDFAFASPPNSSADDPKPMPLAKLLTQIHYLGKR